MSNDSSSNEHFGLALSGGGMRGIAHIGLLRMLEEHHLEPSVIAGTSAGALIGAMYASGVRTEQMLDFFRETELLDISRFSFLKPGLFDLVKYEVDFQQILGHDDFATLKKQLIVVASDILAGEMVVINSGSVIKAILASAAFPGVFTPIDYDQRMLVDGGLFNNLPADLIRDRCRVIVGMDVNPILRVSRETVHSTVSVLRRASELMIRKQSLEARKYCDVFISPPELGKLDTFNQKQLDEAFEIGYAAAQQHIEAILECLDKREPGFWKRMFWGQ
jgi:NTE family protein